MSQTAQPKTLFALIFTLISWSSAFVVIRVALHSFEPGPLALFRYLIASITMVPIFFSINRNKRNNKKALFYSALLGFIGIGVYNIALNYGEITVNAGTASFIIGQMPVLTAILAFVLLSERLDLRTVLGILVSFIGLILIAVGERESHQGGLDFGVILLMLSALCGSLYTVLQKPLIKKISPLAVVSMAIWGGSLFMIIFTPNLLQELPKASLANILGVIYLGVFPAALGYATWSYVLSHSTATKAATSLYAMPFITTAMGWVFLGELPPYLALMGGVVALLGAMVVSFRKRKPQ